MALNHTQNLYLWSMGAIYLFAFASLYFQVPGLYGRNGILPAVTQLQPSDLCKDGHERCPEWHLEGECEANPTYMLKNCKKSCGVCKTTLAQTFREKMRLKFTLLWLSPDLGLDVESGMELICILGMLVSVGVVVIPWMRNKLVFVGLWVLYFSVYQVGQTFLWFQWDILLLESGFITIFVAPFFMRSPYEAAPDVTMLFWLVKWLLFRLMFASGVVKLTSKCPTWWGLTALNYHYESQCIPTPLAWYAHQLPEWFQRLSVVATYVIEIPMPFLFLAPVRSLRVLAFYAQLLLQVLIILTGNYNFFNLLTLTLCLSLIDDQFLFDKTPVFLRRLFFGKTHMKKSSSGLLISWSRFLCHWVVVVIFCVATVKLFGIEIRGSIIHSKVMFTKQEFSEALKTWTPCAVYIGGICLVAEVCCAFYSILVGNFGKLRKLLQLVKCGWFTYIGVWLFAISLVPLTELDRDTRNSLWPIVQKWHGKTSDYHVTNSYGLFRSMTGVGGRPELVIEGSDSLDGGWKEYNFVYKPGNVSTGLPVCTPHQPRLDWQMWFAALGSYHHNAWYVHLVFKLLHGEPDVLNLLAENPFPDKPPRYIRSKLYKYHYTRVSIRNTGLLEGMKRSRNIKNWWRREFSHEYLPPLEKNEQSLVNYIRDLGWDKEHLKKISGNPSGRLYSILLYLRKFSVSLNPTLFMLQLVFIPVLTKCLFSFSHSSVKGR